MPGTNSADAVAILSNEQTSLNRLDVEDANECVRCWIPIECRTGVDIECRDLLAGRDAIDIVVAIANVAALWRRHERVVEGL